MAIVHKCDRCNREMKPEEKIHRINYKISVTPRINDEEINAKLLDNLNDLEFCEECTKIIVTELHKPMDKPQETLGI